MKKFITSVGYAVKGIGSTFRTQQNFRVQIVVAMFVCIAGGYFHVTATEWCVLLGLCGLVLGLELINTSLENLTDLITPEQHPLAANAKDAAAGAVLLASLIALIAGVIIFAPYVR